MRPTVTGRISSAGPDLQRLRTVVLAAAPASPSLLAMDFSDAERRILATFTDDDIEALRTGPHFVGFDFSGGEVTTTGRVALGQLRESAEPPRKRRRHRHNRRG